MWQSKNPQLSTSLAIAPVLPVGLHWLDVEGGVYFPTYSDPTLYRCGGAAAGSWLLAVSACLLRVRFSWSETNSLRSNVAYPHPQLSERLGWCQQLHDQQDAGQRHHR